MHQGKNLQLAPLLVVDDDRATRESVRLLFEDTGHIVLEADNGKDALVMLRESSRPLVVLLDLVMPELGGEGVLRAIFRDRHLRRWHAFILMSALPHLSHNLPLQRMMRALAIDQVPKPFDVADLEEAVSRAQQRQRRWVPVQTM